MRNPIEIAHVVFEKTEKGRKVTFFQQFMVYFALFCTFLTKLPDSQAWKFPSNTQLGPSSEVEELCKVLLISHAKNQQVSANLRPILAKLPDSQAYDCFENTHAGPTKNAEKLSKNSLKSFNRLRKWDFT